MKSFAYATCGLALLGAASFIAPSASSAAEVSRAPAAAQSSVVNVQYGRCVRWRRICRDRWGFGWRFRRCMGVHGCL